MNFYHMADFGDCAGKYQGKNVFPIYKDDLKNKGTGAYYIIVDSGNTLVKVDYDGGYKALGWVEDNGNVELYSQPQVFYTESRKKSTPKKPTDAPAKAPIYAEAPVVGDVKLEIDVDEVLKAARTMTVESLLEGFNYGLA